MWSLDSEKELSVQLIKVVCCRKHDCVGAPTAANNIAANLPLHIAAVFLQLGCTPTVGFADHHTANDSLTRVHI